ncbi:Ornithine decarboxylase antizyme [Madurella mycetomatis]|uniref:Ornithine decarboxylase antizyme n=1 Tax=Madurella mycetomatis TaxID=100816 RepID=A0A175W938_9PEZI|nr:Ornithine decarboxylase antizyme [Madurella mycetomatis]
MAPMKQSNNQSSSNYGEGIVRQANILASCYILALTPKANKSSSRASMRGRRSGSSTSADSSAWQRRRGGAALRIREECERFFCETLRAMFLGERNSAPQHSGLAGVYNNNFNSSQETIDVGRQSSAGVPSTIAPNGQLTPPDDFPISDATMMGNHLGYGVAVHGGIRGWMEIWDYAGGSSFRAFVAEDAGQETRSLFVFFDSHSISRDLKQALVALIELAEGPFACSHMVICLERSIPQEETRALTKGLQWAGFSLTTLDFWSSGFDVVSNRWLFMGMEV